MIRQLHETLFFVRTNRGQHTEGFVDGQVSLDDEHGRTGHLRFLKYVTTATIEHTIDTTDGLNKRENILSNSHWQHKKK